MNSEQKDFVIGILGGMGTYATIYLFQEYVELFPAEKEWERPRIIIDNNCTMPSRVRAVLYNEKRDILIEQMSESIRNLINAGASKIILACNTSHLFLEGVYKRVPEARDYVINIIDVCVNELKKKNIKNAYLLATEGTIVSNVYNKKICDAGIKCCFPDEREFANLRLCIEAVKQNQYSDKIKSIFVDFIGREDVCVLGCTELPILYQRYKDCIPIDEHKKMVIDPLYLALKITKNLYDNDKKVKKIKGERVYFTHT